MKKSLSKKELLNLIHKAKQELKKDKVMQKSFKKYNVDIEEIDFIPTIFKELDVSATTDHGVVYLNTKLIQDGKFDEKDYSYMVHEYIHWLQQTARKNPTKSSDDGDYLENPYEQESFKNQVEYMAKEIGEDYAEDYVDHLLKYHNVKNKKEKKEKKEVLMSQV